MMTNREMQWKRDELEELEQNTVNQAAYIVRALMGYANKIQAALDDDSVGYEELAGVVDGVSEGILDKLFDEFNEYSELESNRFSLEHEIIMNGTDEMEV